jgi:hypothetical protein
MNPADMVGRCGICGRRLTNPESRERGIGPDCAQRAGWAAESATGIDDSPVLAGVRRIEQVGLIVRRNERGVVVANVPHAIRYHSPTGMECGYAGSGPQDLALNALAALFPAPLASERLDMSLNRGVSKLGEHHVSLFVDLTHAEFCHTFIANMKREGGFVAIERIKAWAEARRAELLTQGYTWD